MKVDKQYKSTPAELARAKAYRIKNPDKTKAARVAWLAKNPTYFSNPERMEQMRIYHSEYRKKNIDKVRLISRNYMARNKEKIRENQRKHTLTGKYAETRLRMHLRRKFKITVEQYRGMLEAQNGVCGICKMPCDRKTKGKLKLMPLVVDHCHSTGTVRGLLCNSCNLGLGSFKDNPKVLESSADYLRRITSGRQ